MPTGESQVSMSSSLGFLIHAKLFISLNILFGIPVVLMPEPLDETSVSVIKRHSITLILVFPVLIHRLKEMLRVGDGYGSRISASELENAVFEHPAVHNMIVVGIWDDDLATDLPTSSWFPCSRTGTARAR